jgi:hypothetical protein
VRTRNGITTMSLLEIRAMCRRLARKYGYRSPEHAWSAVDRGELRGTILEVEFISAREMTAPRKENKTKA